MWPSRRRARTTVIPSPERLQETQLGALGVPSEVFIYCYNATNVRKRDDSYDRVVHSNKTTTRHNDSYPSSYATSPCVILRHLWCHYASTTGLALLLRIRQPHAVQTIRPVSLTLCCLLLLLWSPPITLVHKQRVRLGSILLRRCTLNMWASLFPLVAVAALLEVLPEELS